MSSLSFDEYDLSRLLAAIRFAAEKHRLQTRKGVQTLPYINHPIGVADLLWRVGEVRDIDILIAAILHDTVEDTDTTPDTIEAEFGTRVRELVEEVSDDKALPKEVRKELQIEHAPHKSEGAKQIKLADKICNVFDVAHDPPSNWDLERRVKYLNWSDAVVAGLRGANAALDEHYRRVMAESRSIVEAEIEQ